MTYRGLLALPLLFAFSFVRADETMLRTAAELDSFGEDTRRRYTPFTLTGTVESVSPIGSLTVFRDASAWIEFRNKSDSDLASGDIIRAIGYAHLSHHQNIEFIATNILAVGRDTPTAPLRLRLDKINVREHHLHLVETEGTVIDTFADTDPHYRFLLLRDKGTFMPVSVRTKDSQGCEDLVDARIRLTARFKRAVQCGRRYSGPTLLLDSLGEVKTLTPPPADPFGVPALEKTLYRTPLEIAHMGKRRVSGVVLAVWERNKLLLRAPDDRIVNVTLSDSIPPPEVGTSVCVAGYPETDLYRLNLAKAIWRSEPLPSAPKDEPVETSLATVFGGGKTAESPSPAVHGRLFRVSGVVQELPSANGREDRIRLLCGPYGLSVILGTCPSAADDILLGSEVEVTGRCLMETDSWKPEDVFPRIRGIALVLRTPADIRVVRQPPWWTPARLSVVIVILVLALIGAYIWNRVLKSMARMKLGERTRLAVELHDSLSQALTGLACQIGASQDALRENPATAGERLKTAEQILKSCRTELRHCLFDLRNDTISAADLATSIRLTLAPLGDDTEITIRFNVRRSLFDDATVHEILVIVRELVANAIRHGNAWAVRIAGTVDKGRLHFSVRDNGCGFDPTAREGAATGHFGLDGISERLKRMHGALGIDSLPGQGTKVTVSIPIRKS